MSNVKIKDIPFNERYVNLALDDNILLGPMTANLKCLYEFINKNSPGNSCWKYGNAYRAILKKARFWQGAESILFPRNKLQHS